MASEMPKLIVPRVVWWRLLRELDHRGQRRRESGAFLLGTIEGAIRHVSTFVCYDDLDPHALDGGYITFHGEGFPRLWALCRARDLRVVADVHTHPGRDARQSGIDQRHPMLPVARHLALIVPKFAKGSRFSANGVGIHEYTGSTWRDLSQALPAVLRLTW